MVKGPDKAGERMVSRQRGNVVAVTIMSILVVVVIAAFIVSEMPTMAPNAGLMQIKAETGASLGRVIDFALNEFSMGGFSTVSDVWYCKMTAKPPQMAEIKTSLDALLLGRSQAILDELQKTRGYDYEGSVVFDYGLVGVDDWEQLTDPPIDLESVAVRVEGFTFGVESNDVTAKQQFVSEYAFPYKTWLIYKTLYGWMRNDLGNGQAGMGFSERINAMLASKPCQASICTCSPPQDLFSIDELLSITLVEQDIREELDQSVGYLNEMFEETGVECSYSLDADFLVENIPQTDCSWTDQCYSGCNYESVPETAVWQDAPFAAPGCADRLPLPGGPPIDVIERPGRSETSIECTGDAGEGMSTAITIGMEQRFAGFVSVECRDNGVFAEGEEDIGPYTARIKLSLGALKTCSPPDACEGDAGQEFDDEECTTGPGQGTILPGAGVCCDPNETVEECASHVCMEGETLEECTARLGTDPPLCSLCSVCAVKSNGDIFCPANQPDLAYTCDIEFPAGYDQQCVQLICTEDRTWECTLIDEFNPRSCSVPGNNVSGLCWKCVDEGGDAGPQCNPNEFADGAICFDKTRGTVYDKWCNQCQQGNCVANGGDITCGSDKGCRTYCGSSASGYRRCDDTRDLGSACNPNPGQAGNTDLWECNECTENAYGLLACEGGCGFDWCCASEDKIFGKCKPTLESGCCVTKAGEGSYIIHTDALGNWIDCGQIS